MNDSIRKLRPKTLWNNFTDLNAIPRPSKKEDKVRSFMVSFGKKLKLNTVVDPVGNVIIKKPATEGMIDRRTVVLQSHLDMVCQKNNNVDFDFDNQGIRMHIEGDWVTANGTTLGADNGIGVAAIMSVLESTEIAHPAIEALFTIDEETGMTGALGLKAGYLDGEILLNLDTENDNEIAMGCAGGIDITAIKSYSLIEVNYHAAFSIDVKGLNGGHSGIDIHKGYGNANKILNRILYELKDLMLISEIDGGSLRNAIPREASAIVVTNHGSELQKYFSVVSQLIIEEYASIEANLEIVINEKKLPKFSLSKNQHETFIKSLYVIHNGVFRMSPDIKGLVETSNNLAKVIVKNGKIKILCLTRSATEVGKMDLASHIKCGFELAGFKVSLDGAYPGWKPDPNSNILKVLQGIYNRQFKTEPKIIAYHAGLECGILGTNYPKMDMVSFGPTIKRAHSPDEKVSISSTEKFWSYLIEILERIPKKE